MTAHDHLEHIEKASVDELRHLQLERLKWTLRHAYDNGAPLPQEVRRARRPPRRPQAPRGPRQVSVHHQAGPARELPLRHVRGADGKDRTRPRLERHDRQADRRRLHQGRHRHLGARDGAVDPGSGRALHRQDPRRVRLRPLYRRARRALRRRGAGRLRHPARRRHDRAAGAAHQRLQARHHHGDAVLHAGDRRRVRAPGAGRASARHFASASSAPSPGPRACGKRSSAAWGSTRSTSTGSPR